MNAFYRLLATFFGGIRLHSLLYLGGMGLVFLGERVVGGESTTRQALDALGVLGVLASLALFAKGAALAPEHERRAHRIGILYGLVGALSLCVYALGTETMLGSMRFADDEAEHRFAVVVGALWPILWLVGTLPLVEVDRALAANPVHVVPARVREAAGGALSLALALAMLFPLNYAAQDLNKRWDFGYFKTARPGSATVAMVQGLDQPLDAYLFFPVSSDVTDELRTYFDALAGGPLTVHYVDHALEPELAKELKIRDNGYVAFVRGEGEDQQVEKVKIGVDFESAKRTLKKLDSEIQGALLKVARGQKTAYFTVGHGELYWKSGTDVDRRTTNLKKVLEAFNYKVKELGLTEGLANEVPEDADVVVILGPQAAFLPEELAALDTWRRAGGSLLVAVEPDSPNLGALLDPLGVGVEAPASPLEALAATSAQAQVVLANDAKFVPATYRLADRVNVFTNKYSTHASVTTLSRNSKVLFLITPGATPLVEKTPAEGAKTTVTLRSLPDTWADRDGDLEFDAESEERKVWNLGLAVSGPREGAPETPAVDEPDEEGPRKAPRDEFRAVVIGDATWASDLALPLDPNKANFQLVVDTIAWLGHEDEIAGTVTSEEDVKIQHTKEGQGWIFYGTAFLFPLAMVGLGMTRIRLRRKRGEA